MKINFVSYREENLSVRSKFNLCSKYVLHILEKPCITISDEN